MNRDRTVEELEAMADFVAYICDDPENGRKSPIPDRPTGTGIAFARMVKQAAQEQRK